ncbi:MAG: carbon storage regulator CsrA [Desulfovibrionaceae bacterium]
MLILTRRPGESLYLGENIRLKVLSVQGKQIKIGLEVPDDMPVYREEVYLKIKDENQQALEALDQDLVMKATSLCPKK